MTLPIIAAHDIGKRYVLGASAQRTNSLREALTAAVSAPARWFARRPPGPEFWALRDVTFGVEAGQVMGIIGRNGAGKSTLLKVLSRITEPTTGRIELRGRIASLLEVGTGFHPELTGRENVYLNGTILGMRRREIDRKFDEIVDFAEVRRFIDTPVKRYSSGMYVRLAFAVAAHLEPEILVIDEVLAVGDAEFQRKCLGKMRDVAHEGRTVLFVSHNMAAIRGLCTRAIVMDGGRIALDGSVDRAISAYLAGVQSGVTDRATWSYRHRGQRVSVVGVEVLVDGVPTATVQSGDRVTFRVQYKTLEPRPAGQQLSVSLLLFAEGQKLANLWTNYAAGEGIAMSASGTIECVIPKWPFRNGIFRVDVFTHIALDTQDWIEECATFNSHDGDYYRSGIITNADQGLVFLEQQWSGDADQ
jgi:lipopolysaccharide transport system ATP-binding protein